jgi:hypothetical protein
VELAPVRAAQQQLSPADAAGFVLRICRAAIWT